jgi:hypothetical protein
MNQDNKVKNKRAVNFCECVCAAAPVTTLGSMQGDQMILCQKIAQNEAKSLFY